MSEILKQLGTELLRGETTFPLFFSLLNTSRLGVYDSLIFKGNAPVCLKNN
jgi:hypothetical protein